MVTKLVWIEVERAVGELAQVDVAVVDVHAHHGARLAHHALRDEVAHRADDALEISAHPPVADVDDRRAVAFERRRLEYGLVGVNVHLAQRVTADRATANSARSR